MPHQSQQSRRPRTRIALASGLASAAIAATLVPTATDPASAATIGVLCTGFGPCTDAGMSAKGYKAVWDTMFWNMYAGQNCTNYVAYRMIQAGMSATRPSALKAGQGNASYWGTSFPAQTNATPTVGSIAWWRANVPGAGSGGHVAYVEKVYSATDIVVSESNWSGNFDWRRITTAANWPSGFIHLVDSGVAPPVTTPPVTPTPTPTPPATGAPVVTTLPTISGTVAVGQTLTASTGSWSQRDGVTFTYQWYADGVAISGETASTIDVGKSKLGDAISVQVTAKSSTGTGTAMSAATTAVIAGTIGVTTPPQITGTPRISETVTAVPPVTSKSLTTSSVQWYADGEAIPGATSWTLTLGAAQVARQLTVEVHGTRAAFNDLTVSSAAAGPVQAPPLTVATPGGVAGAPLVGSTVTANPGATQPAPGQTTYLWLRDGQPIVGASASTYTLTADDVAHRVAVRVGLTASGYYPMSTDYALPVAVTAPVKLKVHAAGKRRAATAVVKIKSLGALVSGGTVTAKVGKHQVTAKVRGKKLVLRLSGLPTGKRTLKIVYAGTKRYQARTTTEELRVQR